MRCLPKRYCHPGTRISVYRWRVLGFNRKGRPAQPSGDELLILNDKQSPLTREVFEQFKRMVKENKKNLLIEEVNFLEITETILQCFISR